MINPIRTTVIVCTLIATGCAPTHPWMTLATKCTSEIVAVRWPFPEQFSEKIGQPPHGPTHQGSLNEFAWDFKLPSGTPVLAARSGLVVALSDRSVSREQYVPGNFVVIDHGSGIFTKYFHLSPGAFVKEGERVHAGQLIALSGNTGLSGGPHLHFAAENRRGTIPVCFSSRAPAKPVSEVPSSIPIDAFRTIRLTSRNPAYRWSGTVELTGIAELHPSTIGLFIFTPDAKQVYETEVAPNAKGEFSLTVDTNSLPDDTYFFILSANRSGRIDDPYEITVRNE